MSGAFIIGLDLGLSETKLCRYDPETGEPVTVMVTTGGSRAAFPTLLAVLPGEEKWKHGVEAEYFIRHRGAAMADRLLERCETGESFETEGREYAPAELMEIFLKLALTGAGVTLPKDQLRFLCVTLPTVTPKLAECVYSAFENMGLSKDRACLCDHRESFYYYAAYQKPEVLKKAAGLFYREEDRFCFCALAVNRFTKPMTAFVAKWEDMPFPAEEPDKKLLAFEKEVMEGMDLSSVYVIGNDGDKNERKESLAFLCRGQRKVFYGDNLFVKGACFEALEQSGNGHPEDILYLGQDLVRTNIGMEMDVKGEPAYVPLITAGVHWYEAKTEIRFLLNGETSLVFMLSSLENGNRKKIRMSLPGLPKRPPKTTVLKLRLYYENAGSCVIEAEDEGFGEIYPSSRKIWTERL